MQRLSVFVSCIPAQYNMRMAFLMKAVRYVMLNYALLLTSNLRRTAAGSVHCSADKVIVKKYIVTYTALQETKRVKDLVRHAPCH
jgi:hypothetical protein